MSHAYKTKRLVLQTMYAVQDQLETIKMMQDEAYERSETLKEKIAANNV